VIEQLFVGRGRRSRQRGVERGVEWVSPLGHGEVDVRRSRNDAIRVICVMSALFFEMVKMGRLPGVSHHASVSELGGGTEVVVVGNVNGNTFGSRQLTVVGM
jgi:hypothetical protein